MTEPDRQDMLRTIDWIEQQLRGEPLNGRVQGTPTPE
jgi:hypothetical protein